MKRAKTAVPILLPLLLVVGILAVSGRADKPDYPPGLSASTVLLTGAISGTGDPAHMKITFSDDSCGADLEGRTVVANPDGRFGVNGVGHGPNVLYYYYCAADHYDSDVDCCNDSTHDPDYYYVVRIFGGVLEGKGNDTRVIFAAGSSWTISWKVSGQISSQGTLAAPVTYTVLQK